MENTSELFQNMIVPIIVAMIGAAGTLISAAIGMRNEKNRWGAIVTILFFSIFGVAMIFIIGATLQDFAALAHGQAEIVVANFDGIDGERYRIAEFVRDELRVQADGTHQVLIAGEETINDIGGADAARELGSAWNAEVVVWGWYTIVDEFYLRLNLEMLNRSVDTPRIEPDLTLTVQTLPQGLGTFAFQKQLGRDLSNTVHGMYCYAVDDWDCAIEHFSKAIDQSSSYVFAYDNPEALFQYRGGAHYFKEEYRQAIADFEAAREYHKDGLTYYMLGLAYEKTGNTPQSFANYSIAANDFSDPDAYERLAIMAATLSDTMNAVAYYEKAVEGDGYKAYGPDDPQEEKLLADAYLTEGKQYKEGEGYQTALQMLDRVIRMDGEYYEAYYHRGEVHMKLGEVEQAKADFKIYAEHGTDPVLVKKAKRYERDLNWPELQWLFDLFEK